MRAIRHPRLVVALAASVVTLILAGSVALASIPDASGVIHGCIKSTGVLRVIDYPTKHCVSGERPLNWNQTGPAGSGAGQTHVVRGGSTGVAFDYNTLLTLSVPAGSYVISGQVIVSSQNRTGISCIVDPIGSSTPGETEVNNSVDTIPLHLTAVLSTPATLRLRCIVQYANVPAPPNGAPVAAMSQGVLVATQVASIDDQSS